MSADSVAQYVEKGRRLKEKVVERQATGDLMTFSQAAAMLRMRLDEIEMLVEDTDGLTFNVGIIVPGAGIAEYRHRGEYTIEYLGDE